MKRVIKLLVFILVLTVSSKAYASASISAPSTAYTGEAFTIKLNSNAASWEYHVRATGAGVSCAIDEANVSDDLSEVPKNVSKACTATSTGRVTITLTGNWTNAAGKTSNVSQTIYVDIINRPVTPTTTTQPRTTTKKTTQAPVVAPTPEETTTVPVEETTTVAIENPITNIRVVGYDIQFDKNKTEYEINVSKYVDSVYIIVEGDNLESASPGVVDIKDKDSIDVTLPVGDKTYKYTIKINRLTYGDTAEANNIIKGLTATLIIMCLVMAVIVSISVIAIVSLKKKAQDHTIKPINDNYTQNM